MANSLEKNVSNHVESVSHGTPCVQRARKCTHVRLRWRKNREFGSFGSSDVGGMGRGARDRCKLSIGHKFALISVRDRGRKLWLAGKRDGRCPKRKRSATGRASTNRWWSCVSRAATDWNGRGSIESIRPGDRLSCGTRLCRSSRKLSTIAPLSTAVRDSFLPLSSTRFSLASSLSLSLSFSSRFLCCLLNTQSFALRGRVYFGGN